MNKNIILYSLSTAINKGSILLFFPFLTILFTLEDFGKWSLVIIVSNLLIPIISLNGSASVLREGSENKEHAVILLRYFSFITLVFGISVSFLLKIFYFEDWLFYSVLIATFEALLLLYLTYIRTLEKVWFYFNINVIKTLLLFLVVIYAKENKISLDELLLYHTIVVGLFAFIILLLVFIKKYKDSALIFIPILLFSILLIPHGISQWIMSSSDRIILEYILGSKSVGVYSLAYNISLILMLVNSGIALALPTYMIKNYDIWKKKNYDIRFIKYYTIISIFIFIFILVAYLIDLNYFYVLGYYGNEMIPLIYLIYLSIYILGLYYFYANYLFYHKKAIIISKTTFYAALLNVILTILFVYFIGIVGAALATLFAYIYYLYKIRKETLKVDSSINISLFSNITFFIITITTITVGALYAN